MSTFFRKLFKPKQPLVVVSGLPRSGTSMMMKMLDATGIPPLTDHVREADVDNPKGYYEFERVKKLKEGDIGWLPQAEGKAVKIIATLLLHLPPDYEYRVLMMRRKMEEILASQSKMLEHRGEDSHISDEKMGRLFAKHMRQVEAWMDGQPNLTYLDVDYNALLEDPRPHLERINQFLGADLDVGKMAAVVDPELYRQRK
jgi:hypothetical protein